jgi:V/A-type H+-transporting ATPase subunit I
MLIRPEQARWFETYIPRSQTVTALNALAGTGLVELESSSKLALPLDLSKIGQAVSSFRQLERRYRALFDDMRSLSEAVVSSPEALATQSLAAIREWCGRADQQLTAQLQQETRRQRLLLLLECLHALQGAGGAFERLSHRTQFLYKGLFACPRDRPLSHGICAAVDDFLEGDEHNFFVVADHPDKRAFVEETCQARECYQVDIPDWLPRDGRSQTHAVEQQIRQSESAIQAAVEALEDLKRDAATAKAVENMRLLSWYMDNAKELTGDKAFCHVTGWTQADEPEMIQRMLGKSGIHAAIRFSAPPEYCKPPVRMLLPGWAKPFALFVEMLGAPDRNEVDPAALLPFMVSLLFGYMFPDVGHGLSLTLICLLLYRRWPEGRFLIPCGVSAALFGVVFGEVFGMEGIIDPLWIHPLDDPLLMFIPPLIFGIALMQLGLIFNGIEAYWRGELNLWMLRDAAVLLLYSSTLIAIWYPPSLWLTMLALIWYLVGQQWMVTQRRFRELLLSLALLLQGVFELLMNTISFVRVGAFALAHASLTTAILQIGEGIDNPVGYGLFMLIGHLAIIAVEGLVVFVQTTRLVLFEFFTRFLKAEGRIFRPLSLASRK